MDNLTKKNCWNCKINLGEQIVLDEDFKTLTHIATKLGMSYSQLSELGPNGRRKTKKINSPYLTDITLTRLSKGRIKPIKPIKIKSNKIKSIEEPIVEKQLEFDEG